VIHEWENHGKNQDTTADLEEKKPAGERKDGFALGPLRVVPRPKTKRDGCAAGHVLRKHLGPILLRETGSAKKEEKKTAKAC
jgi:hypothetical protein